jgi:hypothetical protein
MLRFVRGLSNAKVAARFELPLVRRFPGLALFYNHRIPAVRSFLRLDAERDRMIEDYP